MDGEAYVALLLTSVVEIAKRNFLRIDISLVTASSVH
jgi:hypothetical protein